MEIGALSQQINATTNHTTFELHLAQEILYMDFSKITVGVLLFFVCFKEGNHLINFL